MSNINWLKVCEDPERWYPYYRKMIKEYLGYMECISLAQFKTVCKFFILIEKALELIEQEKEG